MNDRDSSFDNGSDRFGLKAFRRNGTRWGKMNRNSSRDKHE